MGYKLSKNADGNINILMFECFTHIKPMSLPKTSLCVLKEKACEDETRSYGIFTEALLYHGRGVLPQVCIEASKMK